MAGPARMAQLVAAALEADSHVALDRVVGDLLADPPAGWHSDDVRQLVPDWQLAELSDVAGQPRTLPRVIAAVRRRIRARQAVGR